jgi:molybdate transport system substrate-binding protein
MRRIAAAQLKAGAFAARIVANGLVALALLLAGGCASGPVAGAVAASTGGGVPVELRVSAATTLKAVLTSAAPAFEKEHGVKIVFNFGASGALLKQLQGGAPTDVFASASRSQITSAVADGLISAESSAIFASNDLVILVRKGNPKGIRGPGDLAKATQLTTGDPAVAPFGAKAQEWLTNLKLWDALKPKMVFAQNAAQADDYIARGEVDAGVGFASDAHGRSDIEVAYTVPAAEIKPIAYVAGPVKASKNADLAQAYVDHLLSPDTQATFIAAGFKSAPTK